MATPALSAGAGRAPSRRLTVKSILLSRLLIVLAPIVLLQVWVYRHDYRAKRAAELQANLEVARAVGVSFDAFVDDLRHEERAVGHALTLLAGQAGTGSAGFSLPPLLTDQASAYLEAVKRDYPEVVTIGWLGTDGQVLASSDARAVGRAWPDRSWQAEIVRGRESVVTNVTRPQDIKEARFSIVHGVRDTKGALQGFLVAVVDPNGLDQVINIKRSKGAAVSLMDGSGWLVFRLPAVEMVAQDRDWAKLYPGVRRALAGKETAETVYATYQKQRRMAAEVPIRQIGWVAGAGRLEAAAMAPVKAETAGSALMFALVAALGVLLATVGARTITRPLARLRASARAVGAGSAGTRVPESGPAELADLARVFNQIADEIRTREQALRESEEVARRRAEELQRVMDLAPIAIWVAHDPECRVITGNQAASRFYEAQDDENVSAGPISGEQDATRRFFQDGRELEPAELPMQQAAATGAEVLGSEVEVLLPSGRRITMLGNASPLRDAQGRVRGSIGAFMDITERKEAEAHMAWLASFPQNNPLPVTEVDSSGHLVFVNPTAERALPGLAEQGWEHPWLAGLAETAGELTVGGAAVREVEVDGSWYQQTIASVETDHLRVYGTDITERKRAEEALRESQAALQASHQELEHRVLARTAELAAASRYTRSLIEASLDPLVTISPEGKITDVNEASVAATGVPRDELIGTDFSSYFTEPEQARAGYRKVFSDGFVTDYPLTIRHRGGQLTHVLYNAALYRDVEGKVLGVFAAARDVTGRKRAEELAEAERRRFNDALEMLPAYLVLLTPDYHVTFANRFFRERFGESHGRRCFEYLFGRAEPCENCESFKALKTMAPYEWEWTGPDGRNYHIFDFPFTDTDGATLIMEVGIDITQRKRAEEDLRRLNAELEQRVAARTADLAAAQRLLETVMENTEAHLVYLDPDFNFVWVNSAYARAGRRPKSDFSGHNHFEFYPHEENEAIFRRVRDTGQAARYIEKPFEYLDMPERGVTYWDWTLTPVMNEQRQVQGLVFSLADVTDKVNQRERMLAAERARSELLATLNQEISHRTKNNLAMVVGVLQMQLASERDPRLAEMLQDAIGRIYAFAAVHDQITVTESGEVNLTAAVKQCAEVVSRVSAKGRVVASVEGSEVRCPSNVATNLSVVANELITNAVKHGAPGRDGSLQVIVRFAQRGGALEMSVWNSGNPVPGNLDLGRQTGLGLSLVQSIVVGQYRGTFSLKPKDGGSLAEVTVEAEHFLSA